MRYLSLLILLVGLTITTSATPAPAGPPSAPPLVLGDLRFDWPIPDAVITSPFGNRNDVKLPNLGGGDSIHMGLDMIPKNATAYQAKHTQILASEAGEVWIVFPPPGTPVPGKKGVYFGGHPVFGGCVMLRHVAGGYKGKNIYAYTLYGHMREVWVSEFKGETRTKVKKGDALGLMGTTGESTGAHVHFEILFDPLDFLQVTAQAEQDSIEAMIKRSSDNEKAFWNYK